MSQFLLSTSFQATCLEEEEEERKGSLGEIHRRDQLLLLSHSGKSRLSFSSFSLLSTCRKKQLVYVTTTRILRVLLMPGLPTQLPWRRFACVLRKLSTSQNPPGDHTKFKTHISRKTRDLPTQNP